MPRISSRDPRVETLVASFRDSPVAVWSIPDPAVRARVLPRQFAAMVRRAERHGGVVSVAEGGGVALWLAGDHLRVDLADVVRAGLLRAPLDLGPARLARLGRYERDLDEATRVAAAGMPFAYLWFVAVRPELRGAGHGRRLVEAVIEEARAAGFPQLFLRTQQPQNVPLYRHLGFAELAHAAPAGGPESVLFGKIIRVPRAPHPPRPLGSSLGALE